MKPFLVFIYGMITGALLLYAIGFRTENSVREKIGRELIETLSNNLSNQEGEVQYIEVMGKKGNVTLHIGMTKDSVRILVGNGNDEVVNDVTVVLPERFNVASEEK